MPEESDQEKTEEPTPRRIQEAVKKGQVAFSREVSNFLMFVVLILNILWFAPFYMPEAVQLLGHFVHSPEEVLLSGRDSMAVIRHTLIGAGLVMLLPMLATVFVAFFSSFLQNGVVFSAEPITPKLEKISVLKGVSRLFSLRAFMEFIKGLIKITLIGVVSWLAIRSHISAITYSVDLGLSGIVMLLADLAFRIVLAACAIMLIIAVLDYFYQRFEYTKSLRMSRQELKDEFKQTEGDPQIKSRLRQIRQERAQKRMMAAVPEADVVIRNPTHYAVALQYDQETMEAPLVVALGQDFVAMRIIEMAEEHDVVVVENRPLARALYESCQLDEAIPLQHYQAVAEVIGYVYRLKNK